MQTQTLSTLPTVQGCHVACGAASPSQSGRSIADLQRHNAQLVTTSQQPACQHPSTKLKARSRGVRQLGGRLESNLTGCARRPETYTTRLFQLLLTQWLVSASLGAGRMTSTKTCQPGGCGVCYSCPALVDRLLWDWVEGVGCVGPPLHLLLAQRSMPGEKTFDGV